MMVFDPISVVLGMGVGVGVCLVVKIIGYICC